MSRAATLEINAWVLPTEIRKVISHIEFAKPLDK